MQIIKTIEKYNMLSPGDHVLVAVSGGADSLALLYGLLETRCEVQTNVQDVHEFRCGVIPSVKFSVCHVNHNLRGDESDADADFVRKLCEDISIPFYQYQAEINTKGMSLLRHVEINTKGMCLEEAARNARYHLLYECAQKCGANKIATGHNQNDNAETIILRLCRGTGLTGLCGIPPIRQFPDTNRLPSHPPIANTMPIYPPAANAMPIYPPAANAMPIYPPVIRPLIETSRTEIELFLKKRGVTFRTDSTNSSREYSRNRIRLDVIPILEKINPQIVSQITKNIELFREEESLLDIMAESLLTSCVSDAESQLKLHIPTLICAPKPLQKRAIRTAILQKSGLRDISQIHINQIINLMHSQSGTETHLPGDLLVFREYDFLILSLKKTTKSTSFCFDIPIDTPVYIPHLGQYIQATVQISHIKSLNNSTELCTKYFNYDKINGTLKLRSRLPGDRISLIISSDEKTGVKTGCIAGNKIGSKKLKDELIDKKVPKAQRDTLPLLALGNDILWIIDKEYGRTGSAYTPEQGSSPVLAVEVFKP